MVYPMPMRYPTIENRCLTDINRKDVVMKSYAGSIKSGGIKDVKAPYPQKTQSKPDVQKGKDLRVKSTGKK